MSARHLIGLLLISTLSIQSSPCFAQAAAALERLRLIEDQARNALASTQYLKLPSPGEREVDCGGWATITSVDYRDDDHQSWNPDLLKSLLLQDYRVYVAANLSPTWGGYVRIRNLTCNFGMEPGAIAPDTRRQEGLEVDLCYADYRPGPGWQVRVGRQFVRVGRGLTLSADLDGLGVQRTTSGWTGRVFGGTTLRRDPNIDQSIVGYDERTQDRDFYLAEVEHRTDDGKRYYGYAVVQRDFSRAFNAVQAGRNFHYDSEYLAVGTEGRFRPRLHYYGELIHQAGTTLVDLVGDPRVSIDATGILAGLLYYPEHVWRPMATLEYAFGSGDARRGSVTNTFGGKQTITTDENFLYFGTYDGGLALSPRLSDLHVLRAGYQVRPFPKKGRRLPDLLLGTKVACYLKDSVDGIISDPAAAMASRDVGWGADTFLAYRPLSDVSIFVQGGQFWPGAAYPVVVRDRTDRVLASASLSF